MESITTERPWGSFTRFTNNQLSTVKTLFVKSGGKALSLQYHKQREELWKVLSGTPEIVIGEDVFSGKSRG